MKRLFALLLAAMVVLSLAACGSNTDGDNTTTTTTSATDTADKETTDPQVSGNTYVFESMTENGAAVAEDMATLYADSKYVFNADGTCAYGMVMFGTEIETKGTYTQDGAKVTVTLDYGEDEDPVEMVFTVAEDNITFAEEIDGTTSAQTYKKQA